MFLVSHNNNDSYPEIARDIRRSFETQTKNRVVIKSAADVLYQGKDNVLYPIIEERRGNESPANAYFGGQMAYCMSKDALSMGNIRIIRNHLKKEINYKGDYLLVCEDSNLPNGYRILTELYGDEATLQDNLDTLKSKVRSGILPLKKTGIPTWVLCGLIRTTLFGRCGSPAPSPMISKQTVPRIWKNNFL